MAIRFFESVLLSGFLAMVGYGLGLLIGVVSRQVIEERGDLETVRATITRRAQIERGLEARVKERRAAYAKIDRDIKQLIQERIAAEKATKEALAVADQVIRVVGDEVAGRQRFLALVYNKYLAASSTGAQHALIDPAWAVAQEIEVWSIGVAEARIELEKRYPPSFGYAVTSLVASPREDMVVDTSGSSPTPPH